MAFTTTKSAYWQGVRDGAPFLIVVGPFALLFGVVATEAGLNLAEVMGFSVLVIAGAAQFTALQLMTENAPAAIVLATALAVNLRMAMYSASLAPYLGAAPFWQRAIVAYFNVDQSYAVSMARFEAEPAMTVPQRVAYFMGAITPVCPMWYAFTLLGALGGAAIPEAWALDFAVPITFLAIIGPLLRTAAHVAAALTSVVASLAFAGVPYNLGILLAGALAMAVGAQAEVWLESRRRQAS